MIFFKDKEFNNEIVQVINSYKIGDLSFSMTSENKKESHFALLFAIFLSYLTSNFNRIFDNKEKVKNKLILNFENYSKFNYLFDKSYLQFLTLTLSALYIIEGEKIDFKEKFIKKIENKEIKVKDFLEKFNCLKGKPSSGNYAMFLAIGLIYLDKFLKIDQKNEINDWVKLHLLNMNSFGLWGKNKNLYSNFQNGYHQYEIMKFLNIKNLPINKVSKSVQSLMNKYGGFAPYPGGGACYDYDAIFFLTYENNSINFLKKNMHLILNNFKNNYIKNVGFSENFYCRPLNYKNLFKLCTHPFINVDQQLDEKILSLVSILRYKNGKIKNHWSENPYFWNKPNIFASWFRTLSIAKIDSRLNLNERWKFINFPGIGF